MVRRGGEYAFDNIVNDPESFGVFLAEFVGFAVAGAAAGIAIDAACTHLYRLAAGPPAADRPVAWARLASALVQVVLNALLVYAIWRVIRPSFAKHFQVSLTGMAFVGFFFGAQWNVTYALQALVPFPQVAA